MYSEYIEFEMKKYLRHIAPEKPTLDDCRAAITEIGRLSHSWQDYYAHAIVLLPGGKFDTILWTAFPPITGSPDIPAGRSGKISPSSYQDNNVKGAKGYQGEHGAGESFEPIESNERQSAAREYVAGEFRGLLPYWLVKCKCHAEHLGPLP